MKTCNFWSRALHDLSQTEPGLKIRASALSELFHVCYLGLRPVLHTDFKFLKEEEEENRAEDNVTCGKKHQ